jgi:hypothetical protein
LSGRRIAAMVVNGNAYEQVKRGALDVIAGKPAPVLRPACSPRLRTKKKPPFTVAFLRLLGDQS